MKILIVDDHALVRRGMHYVVKEAFPDAEVLEAESAAAALEQVQAHADVDLSLVDVRMPDLDGLELLRTLKADRPEMPVIVLSTYDNAPYVKRALADGAAGYLLKDATPEDLSQAINVALSGRERPVPARDPEPVRGARGVGQGPGVERAPGRVQPDAAGARHPRLAGRGPGEPRDRAAPVPVREDGEGAPGRDLPEARRHEPDAGRDDGRADGRGPGPGALVPE